ncbi:MAG: hypothetical protein KAI47_08340, partial [Deltaproteobacteria bacterium]|nr:hypothetical protein [Deltaproteobacteria bacterium]
MASSFWSKLQDILKSFDRGMRTSASEMIVWEHRELENIFALLLLGPAAGIAGPPAPLALALLPDLEHELIALLDRARESGDPLGELFSTF